MWQLDCSLCKEPVDCRADTAALRKHIRTEHEVVRYKVEVVVALSCLTTLEEGRLVEAATLRLQDFHRTGRVEARVDIVPVPQTKPVEVKKERNKTKDKNNDKDLEEIQRMMMEDTSDDEEKEQDLTDLKEAAKSRRNDDELLLVEDEEDDDDIEVIEVIEKQVKATPKSTAQVKIERNDETRSAPSPTSSDSDERTLAEEVDTIKLEENEVLIPELIPVVEMAVDDSEVQAE